MLFHMAFITVSARHNAFLTLKPKVWFGASRRHSTAMCLLKKKRRYLSWNGLTHEYTIYLYLLEHLDSRDFRRGDTFANMNDRHRPMPIDGHTVSKWIGRSLAQCLAHWIGRSAEVAGRCPGTTKTRNYNQSMIANQTNLVNTKLFHTSVVNDMPSEMVLIWLSLSPSNKLMLYRSISSVESVGWYVGCGTTYALLTQISSRRYSNCECRRPPLNIRWIVVFFVMTTLVFCHFGCMRSTFFERFSGVADHEK